MEKIEKLKIKIEKVPKNPDGRRLFPESLKKEIALVTTELNLSPYKASILLKAGYQSISRWQKKYQKTQTPFNKVQVKADQPEPRNLLKLNLANGMPIEAPLNCTDDPTTVRTPLPGPFTVTGCVMSSWPFAEMSMLPATPVASAITSRLRCVSSRNRSGVMS